MSRVRLATLGEDGKVPAAQLPTFMKSLGIADPREEPYNGKCDGVTDDTEALKKLHEAINAGTIKGYFVPGPMKITKVPTVITKACDIRFYNNSFLDASAITNEGAALKLEGSLGATAELTADALYGEYKLAVGTAYADGTLLKITDPTTDWDTSTKSKPGEIIEVGSPDGGLVGAKVEGGAFKSEEIKVGQKITEIRMTNLNPEEAGVSIVPASGTIEVGSEVFTYSSVTFGEGKAKFVITEQTAAQAHARGERVRVVPPAGTVYLRTPITQEGGFTKTNKSKVGPITAVGRSLIENPWIKGPSSTLYLGGIDVQYGVDVEIRHPVVQDCWGYGVRFQNCWKCHIDDPHVSNSRWVYYESAGLEGYGIVFVFATQDCTVRGGRTIRTRHSYTQGGGGGEGIPRRNVVEDHKSVAAFADAYDSHGGGVDITLINCDAINPSGQGFNINCPQAKITGKVTNAGGYGVLCQSLTPIGATDYDIDVNVVKCKARGVAVIANSATNGKVSRKVRIRGHITEARENAIKVEGQGEGNTIGYYLKNVDIDVQVAKSSQTSNRCIDATACENIRVRAQVEEAEKGQAILRFRDCKGFTAHLGPIGWNGESASNTGVEVSIGVGGAEGGSTKGVIYEGPMMSLGTGKSTLIAETNAKPTSIYIYPGPDENVDNKGAVASVKKVVVP